MRQPNILFIFTDEQFRDAMSAYGNTDLQTPGMDAIARSGIRFQHSYCAAPVCGPSRASLVTGLMPHAAGVDVNDTQPLRDDVPTMGEIFRAAGYDTAWAGKWHVPAGYPTDPDAIRGFENLALPRINLVNVGLQGDEPTTDLAIEYIRRERDNPFLLAVSLHNPHDICYWIHDYGRTEITEWLTPFNRPGPQPALPRNFATIPDESEFVQICRERDHYGEQIPFTTSWTEEDWRTYLNVYYRLTEHVDKQVVRLLNAIREQGLEDDTLIVFSSDHGEGMGVHEWVAKLMLYENSAAVPLALSWPGVIPADVHDTAHLASGVDLLPTLCDYAGITPPPGLHGRSLRPVIEHPDLPEQGFVATELQPDPKRMEQMGRMIRTARFKYLAFSAGRDPEMLFDMQHDPDENHNLAAQPEYAEVLLQHRHLLAAWAVKTEDRAWLAEWNMNEVPLA